MAATPRSGPDTAQALPLAGFSIAVASDRRRHAMATLLEQLGAKTVSVQAFRSFAQPDEALVREATEQAVTGACHEVVLSSAFGARAWLAAARRWSLADPLIGRFAQARLLARDAATADTLRGVGLDTIWSTAGATTEELLRYLLAQQLSGRRIVVQTDDPALHEACAALRERGAHVIEVPVFTIAGPLRAEFPRRLIDLATRRQVEAIVFISPWSIEHLLAHAASTGETEETLKALRDNVICACLGAAARQVLHEPGVGVITGAAPFAEELAQALADLLPGTAKRFSVGGRKIEIRGHAVVLDGRFVAVQAGPLAILKVLAEQQGKLLSMTEIRGGMPGGSTMDDHAMEMAVSRLRQALGDPGLIQTVLRRGYRLST